MTNQTREREIEGDYEEGRKKKFVMRERKRAKGRVREEGGKLGEEECRFHPPRPGRDGRS